MRVLEAVKPTSAELASPKPQRQLIPKGSTCSGTGVTSLRIAAKLATSTRMIKT